MDSRDRILTRDPAGQLTVDGQPWTGLSPIEKDLLALAMYDAAIRTQDDLQRIGGLLSAGYLRLRPGERLLGTATVRTA